MNFFALFPWLFIAFELGVSQIVTTQRKILNEILQKDYDVNDSPHAAYGRRTHVYVQLYINSFGSLNAANMEYSIDTFLRQKWQDPRLAYTDNKEYLVVQDAKMRDQIWKPDTFFENVKDAKIHMVTMPNVLFRINKQGDVLYSMRLKMTMGCNLKLHQYPFDNHDCQLVLSSYSNTDDIIKFYWDKDEPIKLPKNLEIAQFDLIQKKTAEMNFYYNTGNFSGLQVRFNLRRQNGYHVLQTYIPTILIVSISWVSFWIDPNAVPGRVTLGVTTLLTLTTLASGIRQQLPPVSYVKAIDIWVGMCMIMVFGALLEFTLANWLANRKIPPGRTPCKIPSCLMICSVSADADDKEDSSPSSPPKPATTYIDHARAVDRASRVLFPGSFFIFNLIYWPYFLIQQNTVPF